jgi:ubiquitin C-terminal hydrolase
MSHFLSLWSRRGAVCNLLWESSLVLRVNSSSNIELADLYECEKCSSKKKAMRQFFISKNPLYLLIFIKRFTGNKKITDVMDYPLKLNLEKFTKYSAGQTQYNLHSLVVHRGSMEKGHYYCLTKRSQKVASTII